MKSYSTKFTEVVVEIISVILILLFVYSALSKVLEFQNFQAQLGQSPLLSAYTRFISYAVLIVEFTLALLLAFPKTRFLGLLFSFVLMMMFTAYIIVILNYSSFVPCSCGGILEKLGWKEHLLFNIVFTILAATACLTTTRNKSKTIFGLIVITIVSPTLIVALYINSENTMHRENPFIRRFIQGSATKIAEVNLKSNSLYFAGGDNNTIYAGDNKAPLYVTTFDTILKVKQQHKIHLERENFPFSAVQMRVVPPYFYLMDGTVPVIYKGNIANWKAKLIMQSNNYYFSKAEVIAPNKIAFRAQELKSLNNILGIFTFSDSLQVQYAPNLLQKQIDGFFDTDGMMHFDSKLQKLVYIYYYRNQFIVADINGNLKYRGNTIDTTSKAKLKVTFIKETGQRKIASLPSTVNQLTAVSGNLLFVNSKLIGRFESKKMWKQASIVDVYDIERNIYLSSIYIYDVNGAKVQSMLISGNNLFVIIGHHVHKYRLGKDFFNIPKAMIYNTQQYK